MRVIDDDLRDDLGAVIDVLLPLDKWVNDPKKWKPPNAGAFPWRNGSASLNARSLQVVPLIDAFIAASSDGDLLNRFREVAGAPLAHSPLEHVAEWRATRGLDAQTEFGIAEAQNVLVDGTGKPATRAEIYKQTLPLFRSAAAAFHQVVPAQPFDKFVDGLAADDKTFWTDQTVAKPSFFLKRLLKDALSVLMELRGPLPEPWNSAVAIELGEHRR
ncbi:MAG TPA: hypothetical protein VGA84_13420, partial [Thermoanaerobaculia bacterium]